MARRKFTMDQLKSTLGDDNKKNGGAGSGKYYNFFNMNFDDSCTIRFLPDADEDNHKIFTLEKKMHKLKINGKFESVPCLEMYGDDCPICETSRNFYNEDNKTEGKKYYRNVSHLAQGIIRDDPMATETESAVGKVKVVSMSYQVYQIIKKSIEDGDLDSPPFDFDEGTDFVICRTKSGDYPAYNVGTKFVRRESALTEAELEEYEENMVDLKTLLPAKPDLAMVELKLNAAITGSTYDSETASSTSSDDEDEKAEKKARAERKARRAAERAAEEAEEAEEEAQAAKAEAADADEDEPEVEDSADEESSDGDSVLDKIKARRAKAAAAKK